MEIKIIKRKKERNIGTELKISGKQNFMGIEIPVIEGGFGENRKAILAKTVADIHGVRNNDIQEIITNNISEFEIGVDILDLKVTESVGYNLEGFGYSKMQISKSKNIYLLSEQGYMLLAGFLKTDKAKEIRKQLRREYFQMREVIKNNLSLQDLLMLKVCKAKSEIETAQALSEYNEKIVKPLEETIEKQAPMVGLAELRIDKKGCYSLTDVTNSLGLKRGKITNWAKNNGYIHKKLQEVNKAGEEWFKVYSTDGLHNQIGITNDGLQYIKQNINEISEYEKIL